MRNQEILKALQAGKFVRCKPKGNSMLPRIRSGDEIIIQPIGLCIICKGDIVFCKVSGKFFIHLVSDIAGNKVQISNNHGHVNGWIAVNKVYGRVIGK